MVLKEYQVQVLKEHQVLKEYKDQQVAVAVVAEHKEQQVLREH
jgi:hypothetical protein